MSATTLDRRAGLRVVRDELAQAARTPKCYGCGCLHQTVAALEATSARDDLAAVLGAARKMFEPTRYDCLGCVVCWPALAANAYAEAFPSEGAALDMCPTAPPDERTGWPPLPGDYRVVRYRAPVAVCTLNSEHLVGALAARAPEGLAIVGTLHTENLGIERLIRNVLANPNVRVLIVCGEETRHAVGHLPGQSLASLCEHGLDEAGRIRGARGKRPVLKNVATGQIEAFRRQVALLPMIGECDPQAVGLAVEHAARTAAEPVVGSPADSSIAVVGAAEPHHLVPDPAGYVVVYPDSVRGLLLVEHYTNAGVLDAVVEGRTPAALYTALVERGLVSRLDHAAYLGRELGRAELALKTGERYVQDRAAGEIERDAVADDPPPATQSSCACQVPCADGGDDQ